MWQTDRWTDRPTRQGVESRARVQKDIHTNTQITDSSKFMVFVILIYSNCFYYHFFFSIYISHVWRPFYDLFLRSTHSEKNGFFLSSEIQCEPLSKPRFIHLKFYKSPTNPWLKCGRTDDLFMIFAIVTKKTKSKDLIHYWVNKIRFFFIPSYKS